MVRLPTLLLINLKVLYKHEKEELQSKGIGSPENEEFG